MSKASPEELEYLISRLRDNLAIPCKRMADDCLSNGSFSRNNNSFIEENHDEVDNQ
jgi:hypothetical protein